jgi:poly(hydroxyalkanoate) depolymerase family esterase
MRRVGNTVARLTASSRAMRAAVANDDGRLNEMRGFGSNPGALDARSYVPDDLPAGAALVVVLHGCTQNASVYDAGSGWSRLADRHGFALLLPQQRRANNANLCFNWFEPSDARRGRGEALSISQMVEHMTAKHRLDRSRVFVTGLSAGGAMTSVMLASYPELFAGGAIIAGLPFASANTLPEALERMRGQGSPPRGELAARAEAAADHRRHKPTLSVWHGTRDTIVDPANAVAIVDQWRDLHGLGAADGVVEIADGHRREVWRDTKGRDIIEKYDVKGMGHGTPLDTRGSECGVAGPHMLEANICSTRRIADFWGLTGASAERREPQRAGVASAARRAPARPARVRATGAQGVGKVIEDALRAAGLMR